ncbi:MAG: hypothetical protein HS111_13375 [Kofleriaceae bacterium]|nr:hypothetical protein [Kofleriaceae bacterium]
MAQFGHDESHGGEARGPVTPEVTPTPAATAGAGVARLEELLARGRPGPEEVVALIDAHRGETDAMIAVLHRALGNAFVEQVTAAMDRLRWDLRRREVVAGDPTRADGGYFLASAAERGARWRTAGGDFSGQVDQDGLRSRYRVDDDTAILGGVDTDRRTATLGLEQDGALVGEAFARVRGGDDWAAGVRRPFALGDGATLTPELRHAVRGGGASDEVALAYAGPGTTASGYLGRHQDGSAVGGLEGSHQLDARTRLTGALAHDPTGTRASLSAGHRLDDATSLSGSIAHDPEATTLGLGASHQLAPRTTLSGSLTHRHPRVGDDQTTLTLSERHRSPTVIHGLDVTAGAGARDYLSVSGSADVRLGPRLFAGGFGSVTVEEDRQPLSTLGASLTFAPHEKAALTLAGLVDQDGRLETRLQLDLFKRKLDGLTAFADQKKDALVSLFLSYQPAGPGPRALDDRFGGSQLDTGLGDERVTAGIRIRF